MGRTLVLVSGRWDPAIAVVDLEAALEARPAILGRPRVTPDVPTPDGPVAACGLPVGMVVAGGRIFVVNHGGHATPAQTARMPHGHAGKIAVLDAARAFDPDFDGTTSAIIASIGSGGFGPVGCALTPDGRFLLVANAEGDGTEDGGYRISVFDAASGALKHSYPLQHEGAPCAFPSPHPDFGRYPDPNGIAITAAQGGLVFTANGGSDDISVLRLSALLADESGAEIGRIPLPSGPFGLAVNPDATVLATANRESARTGVHGNTVSLIDITTAARDPRASVRATVLVGTDDPAAPTRPTDLAFSPDGRTLYVTSNAADAVSAIDIAQALSGGRGEVRRTKLSCTDGPAAPRGVRLTPDGRFVVVAGGRRGGPQSGRLFILEGGALRELVQVPGTGNEPYLIEITLL